MARRPRRARRSRSAAPREPRAAEARYIALLRRVWYEVEQTVVWGLRPLLAIWPAEEPQTDAVGVIEPMVAGRPRSPLVSAYPVGRRYRPRQYSPSVFDPPLRRRIWDLTDADLRRLWPRLDPQDVRRYAPWATSREEVYRVAFPAGTPIREGETAVIELEGRVRQAIEAERRATPRPVRPAVEIVEARRPPGAFRIVHPVYDATGRIMLPPAPPIVSVQTIRRQFEFLSLATHQLVTTGALVPVLDAQARQGALFAARETSRVLGIDVRRDPRAQHLINAWRELNINLIESGTMAGRASPQMRPSLLSGLSQTVEDAHDRGIRVEALAGQIAHDFGVADKRAELIARDQTLKLNAQINRYHQQRVGVREYIWSTSRDERVREMHVELEGTTQSYTNPPEIAPGRYGHPGDDYQCRCVAIPIMPPREEQTP